MITTTRDGSATPPLPCTWALQCCCLGDPITSCLLSLSNSCNRREHPGLEAVLRRDLYTWQFSASREEAGRVRSSPRAVLSGPPDSPDFRVSYFDAR